MALFITYHLIIMLGIWLLYGIPSVSLILFFLFLLRMKEFKYSFYRVLQCDMTLNLLCYLNTWIMRLCHVKETFRAMIWVHFHWPFLFSFTSFWAYFFYSAQAISVIIMSAQRLSAATSLSANEFWSKYYLYAYVLLIILSSIITCPVIYFEFYLPYHYDIVTETFHSREVEPVKKVIFSIFFLFQSFLFFAVILVLNIWTIISVKKHFANITSSVHSKNMMRNLTTIAFANTIVFFCVTLWQIFGHIVFLQLSDATNLHIVMILSDILSLSLPYILLIFDKNVRSTLRQMTAKVTVTDAVSGSVY